MDLLLFLGQLDEGISPESARNANPVYTTAYFGVRMGVFGSVVDAGNTMDL